MTDELGSEIRERLGRAELPRAPDRLRHRLASVTTAASVGRSGWQAPGRLGFLVPLAAVLVIAALSVLSSGGGRSRGSDWGPLAVANTENGDQARTEGRLVLTEHCVYLERNGQRTILVWPADRTSWNDTQAVITFRRVGGDRLTLTSGREIAIAGSGSSRTEDGLSADDWVTRQDWVSSPAPDCITDERWFLGDVTAVSSVDPETAVLTVHARLTARCGSNGECAYALDLNGGSRRWTAAFTPASPSADLVIEPGLPASLPPGSYSVTAWILMMSDDIGTGARESLGAESCTARFDVGSGDRGVSVDVAFAGQSCSIAVTR